MYKLRTEDVEEYTRFLSVSSCFLLMVAILPFISTLLLSCETEISEERIFFYFEHDDTIIQKIYDSTPVHFNRGSLNSKEKVFIRKLQV